MMSLKIAINGFGRIGRLVLREAFSRGQDFEIIGINDLASTGTLAHLLKYDSVHGKFKGEVRVEDNHLIVNGKKILVSAEKQIEALPWRELDIILESTGVYRKRSDLERLLALGAKKVLLSAPAKEELDATVVLGVNDHILTGTEKLISNASCTTNCLAPLVKVINDNFGIDKGLMVTVHAYTNDQNILDLPHNDLRRARAAAVNTVPSTTGAAKAVGVVIPEMKGKLNGYAIRVPVPNVSLTDLTLILKSEVTKDTINQLVKQASESTMKGIIEYCDEPIVSSDVIGNPNSSIFDSELTQVIGNMAKVVAWYDNEYGYSCRIVDLMQKLGNML
ncbi:MAG: type I glyceraldehyde-3-phosphate dehydrogenase [Ignavibacteria bacterium]|nr:type I glyceraldehyde-3-phosphate dehydrogenase [Ignavibacteria bacterium]